jgi:OPA family glycerol-3-phosphate transporter-like MFS transporter
MWANVLAPLRRLYAPPPHASRRSDAEVARLYPWYRWRALEATFLGYGMFYLVRNNVAVVTLEMQDALHYSKEMIGDIVAVTALAYGLSKFLMGAVSDRSDARKFMATGLLITAACNFAFGASREYYVHLWLWALNGFAQGMGWPPCGRVMGHWFSESERGLTFSMWNTSHNVGGGLAGVLAAWAASNFGGWQYAFYVPGVVAALGAVYLLWRLRDTPQSVGLPPIEQYRGDYPVVVEAAVDIERELGFQELFVDKVLLNKYVWLLALANFFAYVTRYSMLDWSPTYLREVKGADLTKGGFAILAIEFGGIPSTIFFGWISDRIGGRRAMVAALCMLPIMVAFAAIILTPAGYLWFDYLMLMTIGCFIYPVINLIVIAALDIASKKAIGTAAGFIGLFGYIGRMAQVKGFGRALDYYATTKGDAYAWNLVLYATLICSGAAAALLALMWKTRPRA